MTRLTFLGELHSLSGATRKLYSCQSLWVGLDSHQTSDNCFCKRNPIYIETFWNFSSNRIPIYPGKNYLFLIV